MISPLDFIYNSDSTMKYINMTTPLVSLWGIYLRPLALGISHPNLIGDSSNILAAKKSPKPFIDFIKISKQY
jgi:hypothetical protein